MLCPFCKSDNNRVLETRQQADGELRRRRECLKCQSRFSTQESVIVKMPYVIKKDGLREPFDTNKLRRGLQLACLKRPVSLPDIEEMIHTITNKILTKPDRELPSLEVGHLVMKELKKRDHVAYVRFASVYRTFKDVQEFVQSLELEEL
jgi:transcriptional repressor NrdR